MLALYAALLLASTPLSLSLPAASADGDLCAKVIANGNATTVSEVAGCYNSFALDGQIKQKTLRAINNLVEAYAFTDIMNNSPDPKFQRNVDVVGKLKGLASASFKSDRQFHEAVQDVFVPLNDGHTAYANECYSQFAFLQPLFMVTDFAEGSNEPKIIIQSYDGKLPQKNIQLKDYVGCEVVNIDGVPALKALQTYADTAFGTSKDAGTRLTQTLSGVMWDETKGTFRVTRGAFNGRVRVPEKDFIVYDLKKPNGESVKVSIPWFVKPLNPTASYKDSKSYWSEACLPSSGGFPIEGEEPQVPMIPIEQRLQQVPIFQKKPYEHVSPSVLRGAGGSEEDDSPPVPKFPTALVTGPSVAFFTVSEGSNTYGVFKMSSFAAPNPEWTAAMKKGFTTLKEKGAEKIIFDLSGNGGGVICTAYALLKLISGDNVSPFKTDIRLGGKLRDVAAKASENNILHSSHWKSENGGEFKTNGLITPARYKSLPGGSKSKTQYTNLFLDSCDFNWGTDSKSNLFSWDHKNVVFLTDGMCGSSCALVQNHIKEQTPDIRTVVATSAPKDVDVTPSTLPGGMVYRASYLSSDIEDSGLTKQMDVTLPVAGDFYFAFREAYSRKSPDEVLEYRKTVADVRIDRSTENALNVEKLWLDTAAKVWGDNSSSTPATPATPSTPNPPKTRKPRKPHGDE